MDDHQRLAANPNWGISPDEATIQEQDIEIVRLRTEMSAAHSLNARLGRELDNLRTENEALRYRVSDLEGAQSALQKLLYQSNAENEALRKRVAELEADRRTNAIVGVFWDDETNSWYVEHGQEVLASNLSEEQARKIQSLIHSARARAEQAEAELAKVTKRRDELASQCVDSDELIEELEARLAIAQTSPATAPVGMVLVPIAPTKEMLDAAWADALAEDAAGVWKSMIATSPLSGGRDE